MKDMGNRIERLMEDMEDYIEQCPYAKFSNDVIKVNKDDLKEYLRQLRKKIPAEIKRCQQIISREDAILKDAHEKAEKIVNEAVVQMRNLVGEHEIMRQVYVEANGIVAVANHQAQEILDNATREANAVKEAAVQYTDNVLENVEILLEQSIDVTQANYDNLITSLQNCHSIVVSNRAELAPFEDALPVPTEQSREEGG